MTTTAFSGARIVVTGAAGFLDTHPRCCLQRRDVTGHLTVDGPVALVLHATSLADGLARTVAWYRRAH